MAGSESSEKGAPRHIAILDYLRGIAALAVMVAHFCLTAPDGSSWRLGAGGQHGVVMFFVISGFVLPYALHSGGYRLRDYGRFLIKRLLRLEPPYLASVVLVVTLGVYARVLAFPGMPNTVTVPQLLLHLGYLNSYFGYAAVNQVYWTLAVEFQFYLMVGLAYPLLASTRRWVAAATIAGLSLSTFFVLRSDVLPHWLPSFALGMLVFRHRLGRTGTRAAVVGGIALVALIRLTDGIAPAVVTGAAALLIAGVPVRMTRVGTFFGRISYSLYLLHNPIGLPIIIRMERALPGTAGIVVGLLAASAATIVASYAFARLIEWPAQRWASAIRYSNST